MSKLTKKGRRRRRTNKSGEANLTSNLYFWLPRLVLCFCQKFSGLMMCTLCIWWAKNSWRTFRMGFTVVHVEPRISMITVRPRSHTSSLKENQNGTLTKQKCTFVSSSKTVSKLTFVSSLIAVRLTANYGQITREVFPIDHSSPRANVYKWEIDFSPNLLSWL